MLNLTQVVIDIPGRKAPEVTGAPLRAFLRALGHEARAWGLGVNTGRPEHIPTPYAA